MVQRELFRSMLGKLLAWLRRVCMWTLKWCPGKVFRFICCCQPITPGPHPTSSSTSPNPVPLSPVLPPHPILPLLPRLAGDPPLMLAWSPAFPWVLQQHMVSPAARVHFVNVIRHQSLIGLGCKANFLKSKTDCFY